MVVAESNFILNLGVVFKFLKGTKRDKYSYLISLDWGLTSLD